LGSEVRESSGTKARLRMWGVGQSIDQDVVEAEGINEKGANEGQTGDASEAGTAGLGPREEERNVEKIQWDMVGKFLNPPDEAT
jgi:hypothetical protein